MPAARTALPTFLRPWGKAVAGFGPRERKAVVAHPVRIAALWSSKRPTRRPQIPIRWTAGGAPDVGLGALVQFAERSAQMSDMGGTTGFPSIRGTTCISIIRRNAL